MTQRRTINILAWSGIAVLIIASLFALHPANENTPVVMTPAKSKIANDKPLAHPNVPTTPVTSAVDYTSNSDVLGSPVHKTVSTPVNHPAVAQVAQSSDKTSPVVQSQKDPTPPDPNRPYYDGWGNEFSYDGTLMHANCPNVPDPITGKDNPYCVCPPDAADHTYYLMGYDKNAGAAVCHIEYYHACPYSEGVSADDPMCYKLGQEQQQ